MNITKQTMTDEDLIVATCVYSAGGQLTEEAIVGAGVRPYCMHNCIFETNDETQIADLKAFAISRGSKALVLDCHWTPSGYTALSHGILEFAQMLWREHSIETFALVRSQETGWSCELWRFNKPLKFKDMDHTVMHVARIGSFGADVLNVKDGKKLEYSGGDRGMRDVEHALRNWQAFRERDWSSVITCIRNELSL